MTSPRFTARPIHAPGSWRAVAVDLMARRLHRRKIRLPAAWLNSERTVFMSVGPISKIFFLPLLVAAAIALAPAQANAETLEIGIGIQNTTTNTVTGGAVLKELGLFEKQLPKTGKYQDFKYTLSWQND